MVEITFEPLKKWIVHGVQEYTFEDLIQEFVDDAEAGGSTIRTLEWADGVAMQNTYCPIDRMPFSKDFLEGTQHILGVTFALKEKFEKQIIKGNVTINFRDESEIPHLCDLAKKLKEQSRYKTSSQ